VTGSEERWHHLKKRSGCVNHSTVCTGIGRRGPGGNELGERIEMFNLRIRTDVPLSIDRGGV
jgi:hypothetical protein